MQKYDFEIKNSRSRASVGGALWDTGAFARSRLFTFFLANV